MIDAPPVQPLVRFTSVTSSVAMLRPGLYGFDVFTTLQNDLDHDVTGVAATLSFGGREAQFRWRDADRREGVTTLQPTTVSAHGSVMFHFVVDARTSAAPPGPVVVNGVATFVDGSRQSAMPSATPLSLPFMTMNAPIVVTTAMDETTVSTTTSLREALAAANAAPGADRIVFDPTLATATIALDRTKGPLPTITEDLAIDGNGVTMSVDMAWQTMPGSYGFRVSGGLVAISDLHFKDLAFNYKLEDVSTNNCGAGDFPDGGAIRVDGGTLILDENRFSDANVPEKNCYAAALRIHGGTGHRIVHNTFTAEVMDTMYIDTAVKEVSDNVMSSTADPTKGDECIFINSQGNSDLWITGNTCVDKEYSGVIANGGDAGDLYLINNTFVRTGIVDLGAVRRSNARTIHARNNIYVNDNPAAFIGNNAGALFDIAYEDASGSPLCQSCSAITPTNILTSDPLLDSMFVPGPASPAIDSGQDWIDVNGRVPGHFNGAGPDRGANETP